jgi:hypothetical protein
VAIKVSVSQERSFNAVSVLDQDTAFLGAES